MVLVLLMFLSLLPALSASEPVNYSYQGRSISVYQQRLQGLDLQRLASRAIPAPSYMAPAQRAMCQNVSRYTSARRVFYDEQVQNFLDKTKYASKQDRCEFIGE